MKDADFAFLSSIPQSEDKKSNLKKLNRQGLFPSPTEPDFRFFERVDKAIEQDIVVPQHLKDIFDIDPVWVPCTYSNEGLGAWEGACTWISDHVMVQLRKNFKDKETFYWIYKKDELLSHELVHAVRASFKEEIFEEFLAYQTSRSAFRRLLGPLFRSPKEGDFFMVSMAFGLGLLFFLPLLGLLISFGIASFFGLRLFFARNYFFRASQKIREMTGLNPFWIMLRLSDAEIKMFAVEPEGFLWKYIDKKCKTDLRWQMIKQSYF